jgi:PAS domain S-box-containing protein
MIWYAISALGASLTGFVLGTIVFLKNKSKAANRYYGLFHLCMGIWCTGNFIMITAPNEHVAILADRFVYFGAVYGPVFFTELVYILIGVKRPRAYLLTCYIASTAFLLLVFTPLFISGEKPHPFLRYSSVTGPAYPIFVLYFVGIGLYAFYRLFRCYLTSSAYLRNQLKYIFAANMIVFIGAVTYFLLLSGVSILPLDNIMIIIYAFVMAYAIAKYHIMDINIVIRKGVAYGVSIGAVVAGYVGLVTFFQWLFQEHFQSEFHMPLMANAIVVLMIAFVLFPLKQNIERWVDRAFYKGKYDYHKVLRKTGKQISTILDVEKLGKIVADNIMDAMHVEIVALFLYNDRTGKYQPVACNAKDSDQCKGIFLNPESTLIQYLKKTGVPLIREEDERILSVELADKINRDCKSIGCELAIPVNFEGNLIGVLSLGNKISGDIYSDEDLQLLAIIAGQIALAFENTKLYGEVVGVKNYVESILHNLASGVITVDLNGNVTAFNKYAEGILGIPAPEAIGKSFDAMLGETNGKLKAILDQTIYNGKIYSSQEVLVQSRDNKLIPAGISTSILKDRNRVSGAIMALTDLTTIKQLEQKMRRSDRLASFGTVAAGIAHEIKNPLVSIKTFIQLLPKKYLDQEFRDSFSGVAAQEVEKINNLINQLLDFVRPYSLKLQPADLHELMNETLLLVESQLTEKKIKVMRQDVPVPETMVDRERMKQVLLNLILNSIDAVSENGNLWLSIMPHYEGFITIEFADNGCGIQADNLQKIFTPFFTTKHKGSGLGLAMVNRIIEEHNGSISLESTPNVGTRFTIELPIVKGAPVAETAEAVH